MKNVLNRNVPDGFKPFIGSRKTIEDTNYQTIEEVITTNKDKRVESISKVFDIIPITDGMTLSFHHHLRNGDEVMNMVMQEILKRDLKNIKLAPSAIFPNNEIIAQLIKNGNVIQIYTNYLNGEVAKTITSGAMKELLIMDTHGGRARAIATKEIVIDCTFVASPCADSNGNANGINGKSACGALGYIIPDVMYAKNRIIVTDNLVENLDYIEIAGKYIDYIITVDSIGDADGIVSGTTNITRDPLGLKIARDTAILLNELGYIKNGFSMQTGAGGTSLAVTAEVKKIMLKKGIKASFASGGITGFFVEMLEEGLIEELYDVQCFDLKAVKSYGRSNHHGMSSSVYANPYDPKVIVDKLDFVILGATEIDIDFNVNVTTSSMGDIIGGSGGHADAANGANLTIITTNLLKSRLPIIQEKVTTITTPGEDVDVLVTERGIAINPRRKELIEKLKNTKLKILPINELLKIAHSIAGVPKKRNQENKIIGVVRYRDGTIIDSLYQK
jgi:citrate lyase subunit alpha/citrate CoA-transferase